MTHVTVRDVEKTSWVSILDFFFPDMSYLRYVPSKKKYLYAGLIEIDSF
jgi:hypothetical protein